MVESELSILTNVFEPQHLQGASTKLVQSIFKIGSTAAQLEGEKLQAEIQKEKSKLRRKLVEKQVKMASGKGVKGGRMKSLKQEDDDDNFLEDLVVDSDPKKPKKSATYSNLKPGGFVTKAKDRNGRLEKRQAKIEMAKDDDDDDDYDDEEETEKEQLKQETKELENELRKNGKSSRKGKRQRRMRKSKTVQ